MLRRLAAFGGVAASFVACLITAGNLWAQATVQPTYPTTEPVRVSYASAPESSPAAEEPVQTSSADAGQASDSAACSSGNCGRSRRRRPGGWLADRWHNHWKPCLQWTHWGYDEFHKPRPLGDAIYGNFQAHVWSGLEAQLVVYQCDFHQGVLADATALNDHGRRRLARLAEIMDCGPFTLNVEEVPGDVALSRARYATVIEELSRITDSQIDPERVVLVGPKPYPGYHGREGVLIGDNLLKATENAAIRQDLGGFTASGLSGPTAY